MAKRTTSRAAVVPRHPCFGPLRAGTGQCDVNRGRHGPVLDKGAIDPGPTRTARGGRSNARGNNRFCSEALILLRASREHERADCPLARGRGSIARHAPRGGAGARAIVQHRPSDSFVGIEAHARAARLARKRTVHLARRNEAGRIEQLGSAAG